MVKPKLDFPFRDEAAFQKAVVILLRQSLARDVVWFHVPNGEWRHVATAKKLKEMGARAGVADLLVFREGLQLALELKTPGGQTSDDQDGFKRAWCAIGGKYEIVRSLDQVRAILWRYDLVF